MLGWRFQPDKQQVRELWNAGGMWTMHHDSLHLQMFVILTSLLLNNRRRDGFSLQIFKFCNL